MNATITDIANVTVDESKNETNSKNETELSDKKQIELDDLLNELAPVPPLRKCEITYAYKYLTSNWTECDSKCGEGKQKRDVNCIEIDPTTGRIVDRNHPLPDIYCRYEKKPISERVCNQKPCKGVDWVTSEWSKCIYETEASSDSTSESNADSNVDVQPNPTEHLKNRTKLSSIQTRIVLCTTNSGVIYDDEYCGINRKPETKRKCDKKQDVAQWFTSEWSACSSIKCGKGFRTRTVACAVHTNNTNGEQSIRIVDEKDCNENLKPNCEEECTGENEICDEQFLVGPWSGCVDRCEEMRSLICLVKNQTTNNTEPIECEDRNGNFELKRKCQNEDAKDSVDPVAECNPEDLAKNCTSSGKFYRTFFSKFNLSFIF